MQASKVIIEKIMWYCNHTYTKDAEEREFKESTIKYVEDELSKLDFYSKYDKNFSSALTGTLISVAWSIITGTTTMFGVLMAALPVFAYSFTDLVQTAVLVNLGYTFRGRYAIRMGKYLGF